METVLEDMVRDVTVCATLESLACGKGEPVVVVAKPKPVRKRGAAAVCSEPPPPPPPSPPRPPPFDTFRRVGEVVAACRAARKRNHPDDEEELNDRTLCKFSRFTDNLVLAPYRKFLHFVPRLVNIVTLAEAIPVPGTGLTLPLDLTSIAAKCNGAYFAPKRFAAVQLAYTNPRCRILVFHTGRIVGTGCSGPMAARLAIALAQRQLAREAGVHLWTRNFAVINTVGAVSLRATLNCEGFADRHRATSHYDLHSFVGLAWRPTGESICCEIYGTGRANLPGSRTERDLLGSFSRMLPELLRFSSSAHLLDIIPEDLKRAHRGARVRNVEPRPQPPPPPMLLPPMLPPLSSALAPPDPPDPPDDNGVSGIDVSDAMLAELGL